MSSEIVVSVKVETRTAVGLKLLERKVTSRMLLVFFCSHVILRFLQQSLRNKSLQMNDYKIALLCNAYSTNSECFTLPMGALVETIYGNGIMRVPLPGTSCLASASVTPLPMNLLDSLTVHAKMRCVPFFIWELFEKKCVHMCVWSGHLRVISSQK